MSGPPPAGAKPTAPKGAWGQPAPQGAWGQPARSGPSSDPPIAAPSNPLFRPPVAGTTSVLDKNTKAAPPPTESEPDPNAVEITDDVGISISPLYKDKTADETVTNIFALLNSVGVRNFDVKAIRVNLKEGYAKIELPEKAIEEYLVKTLRETYKLKNQFNFSTITDDFEKFSVKRLNNYVDPIIQPPQQRAHTLVTSKTSMPTLPPCQCHERFFYKYGETIGFESKTMEFKCGKWNMRLQENVDLVGKYVCAFLNGGGGIMYLGVEDNGKVIGIPCKEEQFLLFQNAIRGVPNYIRPRIEKTDIQINKIKVRDLPTPGQVCVMEVCIKPLKPAEDVDSPYTYNGKSYWRREASTHMYQVTSAPVLVDSKTSMPSLPPCDCPLTVFYTYGQNIGFESRQMEFKAGGYISKNKRFQELLGKYLCGFLNSGGGILYFGVDDSGVVKGLTITASGRARIHRNINIVVGRITPHITESDYSVNFAQVKDADGEVMDKVVVEFCVKPCRPRSDSDEFYVYEGHVYVRFEGSCHRYPRENWTKLIS